MILLMLLIHICLASNPQDSTAVQEVKEVPKLEVLFDSIDYKLDKLIETIDSINKK